MGGREAGGKVEENFEDTLGTQLSRTVGETPL